MTELQKAIEEITNSSKTFPEQAFQVITANKEEAIPYLRGAISYAASKGTDVDEDYQLHFYAMYLLGEFRDRESFPMIMQLVSLRGDTVDYLIGDCVTEGLNDILYNTYNGDMELLKRAIQNRAINEFVRSAMLDVMGQLYLDGSLKENEWKGFLRQVAHDGGDYDYTYSKIGYLICRCHFSDMLPDIRYMFDKDLIDEIVMGKYDSYVDAMFTYRERDGDFCKTAISTAGSLRHWTMFSKSESPAAKEKDFGKLLRDMDREWEEPARRVKIGRNEPCPCGSGKKYKYCCMNKKKDAIDLIESLEERNKWLKGYPYTGTKRVPGRIYLADYFDETSIEIDKILYLALMNRPGLIWKRDKEAEEKRAREYLYLAFQRCVERMDKEQIPSLADYDEKYSIHYQCGEWMSELCRLLEESNDTERHGEVREFVSGRQG